MEKKPKSKIVKTEVVSEEEDLDCFGNYEPKELLTCQKCALKEDCSIVTEKIKSERFDFRPRLKQMIDKTKNSLSETPQVVELVSKIKTKQKKMENTIMSKPEIVKKKKSSVVDEPATTKVLKKKSSKTDEESTSVKAKKPEKTKAKSDIETIGESTIPTTFKALHKAVKEMGTMDYKASVTNVKGEHGILFCIPVVGRSTEKLEVFVNRSGGYKFKDAKNVEFKTSKKGGESILVVKNSDKSITEAVELLTKWKKDQSAHLAANGGKKKAPKADKTEKSEKKSSKKVEEKTEKKLVKKEKEVESPKKSPPVIKAKKKVEVEDEEG
jgi:hypothetical protein